MSDFHNKETIAATRKPHRCGQCECRIAKGERAVIASGLYDGNFYREHTHVDCEAVAYAYAKRFDCWGEDIIRLHDIACVAELRWLIGEHSAVAERLRAEQRLADREQLWRSGA